LVPFPNEYLLSVKSSETATHVPNVKEAGLRENRHIDWNMLYFTNHKVSRSRKCSIHTRFRCKQSRLLSTWHRTNWRKSTPTIEVCQSKRVLQDARGWRAPLVDGPTTPCWRAEIKTIVRSTIQSQSELFRVSCCQRETTFLKPRCGQLRLEAYPISYCCREINMSMRSAVPVQSGAYQTDHSPTSTRRSMPSTVRPRLESSLQNCCRRGRIASRT